MHIQTQGGLLAAAGPPVEASLRKPFLAEPKPLAIIHEDLKGSTTTVREDEQRADNRVGVNPTFDTGQVLEKVREHRAQIS